MIPSTSVTDYPITIPTFSHILLNCPHVPNYYDQKERIPTDPGLLGGGCDGQWRLARQRGNCFGTVA